MSWVMVPVPVELVADVNMHVLRLQFSSDLAEWDADAVAAYVATIDEQSVQLLAMVARGVVSGADVEVGTVADRLGISRRELYGLVHEVNDVRGTGDDTPRSGFVLFRSGVATDASGASSPTELLFMANDVAAIVDQALAADGSAAVPSPAPESPAP